MPEPTKAAPARDQLRVVVDDPAAEIDSVSLEQALIDFEIANRRVIDLTQRLIEATRELADTRAETIALRDRARELETQLDAYRHSRAVKLAGIVRGAIRSVRH